MPVNSFCCCCCCSIHSFIHLVNLFGWLNILFFFFAGILHDAGLVIVIIMTSLRSAAVVVVFFPTWFSGKPGFWNQDSHEDFFFFFSHYHLILTTQNCHTHITLKPKTKTQILHLQGKVFTHTHIAHGDYFWLYFFSCFPGIWTHTQTQLLQYSKVKHPFIHYIH